MKIKERMKAGGSKLVSGAMSVVLAVGLMPMPAYAIDLQAVSLTTQSDVVNGSMSTKGQVLAASMAAANPAPEILGLTNPIQRNNGEGETTYEFFGNDETNTNPDPYLWNYIHGGTPAFKSVGQASPMTGLSNKPYGTDANGNWAWDQKPDIVVGTGSDNLPVSGANPAGPTIVDEERYFYDSDSYARAAEEANGWESNSYHPIGVTYNRQTLPDMVNTMYRIAQAADEVIADNQSDGAYALTARYTDPTKGETVTDIAMEYERYAIGQKGAVLKAINDTTSDKYKNVNKRTVAIIGSYDASAKSFGLVTKNVQNGTAATNRMLESVEGVANNYYDTKSTVTADDLRSDAVDLIIVSGDAGSDLTSNNAAISALSSAGLLGKTYYATTWNNGSAFGLTVNSVENLQNVGRILPCLYPEVLDQSDMIAYYYDVFYHIKESARTKMIAEKMEGVRNWEGNDTNSYTTWTENTVADYNYAKTEKILKEGVAYLIEQGSTDPYLAPTDIIKKADSEGLKDATVTFTNTASAGNPEPGVIVKIGTATLTEGTDYTVSYSYKDSEGKEVAKENVKAGNTGTATITGLNYYADQSTAAEFTIAKTNFAKSVINVTFADGGKYTYTGAAIVPDVTVALKSGTVLTEGSDYSIAFSDNTNAGTAKATITGQGSYVGVIESEFTIEKKTLNANSDKVAVSIADQSYTGAAVTPAASDVTLRVNGTVLPSTDITVGTASNNTNVGNATVALTLDGNNITGTISDASFKIVKGKLTDAIKEVKLTSADAITYNGKAQEPAVTVAKADGYTVSDSDYTVTYGNNVNAGTGTIALTAADNGNYTGIYYATFSINAKAYSGDDGDFKFVIPDQVYTGSAIEAPVAITDGDATLTEGTDFTVAYSDNTAVSEAAKATITFKGNYSGSAEKTFKIVSEGSFKADALDVTFGQEKYTYTGKQITPTVTVKNDDATLTEGTDYIVAYGANVNAGEGQVMLTGIGSYAGSFTKTFAIDKLAVTAENAASAGLVATIADQMWTDADITSPAATVKLGDVAIPSDQYTVKAENAKDVKAEGYSATIEFNENAANLSGSFTTTFKIVAVDLSAKDTGTTVKIGDQEVDGESTLAADAIKDDIKVTAKVGGVEKTLTYGEDYTVELAKTSGFAAGDTVKATITGKGNYTGEAEGSITIVFDLSDGIAVVNKMTYTGAVIVPGASDMQVALDGVDDPLVYGTDYTVTCSDSEVGNATVTITGTGKYTGSFTENFKIVPADLTKATITIGGVKYLDAGEATNGKYSTAFTGSAIEPKVTVEIGGTKLVQDEGFYVFYDDNTAASDLASFSIYGDGVNCEGNFDGYFTISRLSLASATVTGTSKVFAGSKVAPTFTVKRGSTTLKSGTDYTVTKTSGATVGTEKVQVVGKGNYSAAKFVTLNVVSPTITVANATYTGKALKPTVTVKVGSATLKSGTDYTAAYSSNTNAGTGKVTITGKGAYAGTATKNFTIAKAANPLALKKATVSLKYNKTKAQTIVLSKYLSKAGQGTVTYTVKSAKKGSANVLSKKYFTYTNANKTKGIITVAKNTPKGTYTVGVSATAAGNTNYKASDAKATTLTIVVK